IAVLVPPAWLTGLPGQPEERGSLRLVGDAVEGKQVSHIARFEAHPAELKPTDLGMRRPDLVSGGFPGDPLCFPEPAQLSTQSDTQHGRPMRQVPCLTAVRIVIRLTYVHNFPSVTAPVDGGTKDRLWCAPSPSAPAAYPKVPGGISGGS